MDRPRLTRRTDPRSKHQEHIHQYVLGIGLLDAERKNIYIYIHKYKSITEYIHIHICILQGIIMEAFAI